MDTRVLHRAVRAELRSLPKDLAEIVAGHLVVAGQLIDEDPELAYAHAEAARRRAARLPIVREAAAETAYAAGHYDVALSEFRALRRMTGSHDYLPVMADCERALGRPHNALKLAKESERLDLDPALRIEMIIVEAGARHDLGQDPEARRILDRAVHDAPPQAGLAQPTARLRYAYADALLAAGRSGGRPDAGSPAPPSSTPTADRRPAAGRRAATGSLIDFDDEPGARTPVSGVLPALVDGYDAALFDLDGVVYLGPVAVAGAAEGIAAARGPGHPARLRHQQCRPAAGGRRRAPGRAGHPGVGRPTWSPRPRPVPTWS